MPAYRYLKDGKPLQKCPDCGFDLTKPTGIDLELSIDGRTVEVPSRLDENGCLQDTDDDAVANGYHSSTNCGGCFEMLLDLDGVEEYDDE